MHQKDLLIFGVVVVVVMCFAMLNKMDYFIFLFVLIVNQWHKTDRLGYNGVYSF